MTNFLDAIDRCYKGPQISERDYDLKVFTPRLREVVKEYDIKYDPQNPIPSDDKLADDIFKAALDFYRDVGTYCLDTGRIIKFEEEEITNALNRAPKGSFGEGCDAKVCKQRKPEDETPPWCFIGAGGAAVSSEDIFLSLVEGYGSTPLANSITTPNLMRMRGQVVQGRSPYEVYNAIRTVVLAREALRRAGRPGLPIMNSISTAESATATIAGSQFGLRPSDGWLVGVLAELKVDFDRLSKVAYLLSLNANVGVESGPIFGGFCGGLEGTAVVSVANNIQGLLIHQATYHLNFPIHYLLGGNTGRDLLWVISTSGQAVTRNSPLPMFNLCYLAAPAMTDMVLYETATWVIGAVASGLNIEAEGVAKATHPDYFTPLEPRFATEVAHSVTGMKRREANDLVKALLPKYENRLKNPPAGKRYQECFDMKKNIPSPEYLTLYRQVRKELEDLGLNLKY